MGTNQTNKGSDMLHSPLGMGGATAATVGIIDLVGHLGPTGVLVAGIAGIVAYNYGNDALGWIKEKAGFSEPAPQPKQSEDEEDPRTYEEIMAALATMPDIKEDEDSEETPLTSALLPVAPSFDEMKHLITSKRLPLCYDAHGPVYGSVEDVLSMCIVGKPGRGKSVSLLYYVALLCRQDAEIHMWDPHGSLSELSEAGIPNFCYTDDRADIPTSVKRLQAELEERRQLYRRTKQVKRPLVLLVDELPVIASYAQKKCTEVFDLLECLVLEARKWNCFCWLAGQSTDAEILPTRVRDNLSSRIVFFCSDERARMAGLTTPVIKALLPELAPDTIKGNMIFDCARLSKPFIGAVPFTSVSDVAAYAQTGNASRKPIGNSLETATQAELDRVITDVFPVSAPVGNSLETGSQEDFSVSEETLACIRRMKEAQFTDREIAALVGLSGRNYKRYQQALVRLGYVKQA